MTQDVPNDDLPDLLYGVPAIARFLGLRERQTRELIDAEKVPSFKIGNRVCARRSSLKTWLAEQEAKPRG